MIRGAKDDLTAFGRRTKKTQLIEKRADHRSAGFKGSRGPEFCHTHTVPLGYLLGADMV